MSHGDGGNPAFPSIAGEVVEGHDLPIDRWRGGLTKLQYAAVHIAAGFAASGRPIPELAEIWGMAEKLLTQGEK